MPDNSRDTIFLAAIEIADSSTRDEFLQETCGNDAGLKREIDRLIEAHLRGGSILDRLPNDRAAGQTSFDSPHQIGPYKIREQIGEGGMGVVYVAEQTEPVQRKVAIKIIKPGMDTKEVIARFEAERQALAFMEHPNIARVLDAGATESGRSYFVMELVRGIPITEYCDQVKATPRERLELFQTVCDAVQHAHQKGIIHRDIKPSNVLVTQVGAKPVVKVIDFGLAKATSGQKLTDKTVYTGFMKLMGTPVYMSPEQAGLSGLDIDTRSDVYSLGILLYELLTGTTPLDKTEIQKKAYDELCRQIREVEAPKPSSRISTMHDVERSTIAQQRQVEPNALRQLLNGDLDLVALKALEKDRDRRYGTPLELAADIDRFLNNMPVMAVPPSPFYLAKKYLSRHRVAILATAALLSMLTFVAVFSTWQAIALAKARKAVAQERDTAVALRRDAVDAKRSADDARFKAEAAEGKAVAAKVIAEQTAEEQQRLLYASDMTLAARLWSSDGDTSRVGELLANWVSLDDSRTDRREFAWRYLWTQLHKSAIVKVRRTTGASVSAAGNLIVADKGGIVEVDDDGTRLPPIWSGDASMVRFSPNRRWAAVTIEHGMKLIDLESGQVALEVPLTRCSFSARGEYFVAWHAGDKTALVWYLANGKPKPTTPISNDGIVALPGKSLWSSPGPALSDDGRSFMLKNPMTGVSFAYLADQPQPVKLWQAANPFIVVWSPNGRVMVSGGLGVHLRLTSFPSRQFVLPIHNVHRIRFSPKGDQLVFNSEGTIYLWDTSALLELSELSPNELTELTKNGLPESARPQLIRRMKTQLTGYVESLTFSADGARLALFSEQTSMLWDLRQLKGEYQLAEFGEDLFGGRVAFEIEDTEQGVTVAAIEDLQTNDILGGDLQLGDKLIAITDQRQSDSDEIGDQSSGDVNRLLAGPHQSTVSITVQTEDNEPRDVRVRRSREIDTRPYELCFAKDGKMVVVSGMTGTTSLDLTTGVKRRYPYRSTSVGISPDGKFLAMVGAEEVLLWDLYNNQPYKTLDCLKDLNHERHKHGSLEFSPDGRFLAMTKEAKVRGWPVSELKVWRVSDWTEVHAASFQYDQHMPDSTFTPDGAFLVTIDRRGIVRVWDTETWKLDRQFNAGKNASCIAISHDGKTLALGLHTRTEFWDFGNGRRLSTVNGGDGAWSLDFSPDGQTLVSGRPDGKVVLWSVETGRRLRTFQDHTGPVTGVRFSPNGNTLATVGFEGVLRLWDAFSREEIDHDPDTLDYLLLLSARRIEQEEYAEAEAILSRVLKIQKLLADDLRMPHIRGSLRLALTGQGKMPVITRQPTSVRGMVGEEATFQVQVEGPGPWSFQWYHNGQKIEGASQPKLIIPVIGEESLGHYQLDVLPLGRESLLSPVHSDYAYLYATEPAPKHGLQWEVFRDTPGATVKDLTDSQKFQENQPDERTIVDAFEMPSGAGKNYGGRLSGWIVPPETGEYLFYLCANGEAELFLSKNESLRDEQLITSRAEGAWKERQWQYADPLRGKSLPIHLERGKRYSIRALIKGGTWKEFLDVTWQMPGQPPPRSGALPIPSKYLQHRRE